MLPLSTRITLSFLFSVFVSSSSRSTMPIWWVSFLLVQPRVLLCTLLNPLPIQLHFLCHGGSCCIRIPRDGERPYMRKAHPHGLSGLVALMFMILLRVSSCVDQSARARACARTRAASRSEIPCESRTYQYYVASDATFSDAKKFGSGRHYVASQAISRSVLPNYGKIFIEESIRAKSYFIDSLTISFH